MARGVPWLVSRFDKRRYKLVERRGFNDGSSKTGTSVSRIVAPWISISGTVISEMVVAGISISGTVISEMVVAGIGIGLVVQ